VVGDVVHWRCEQKSDEIVRWKTEQVSHTGDARVVEAAEVKAALKRVASTSNVVPKVVVADCVSTASQHAVTALPPYLL